ncbi:MAG: hypothetical protein JXQ71_13725 [Verrucomicrobia bacterium]|nr:hypothetical protein [Verrucomicrobiota bacterium]
MKRVFLLGWLLLPLPVLVWHYGPGQHWLARDHAHVLIQRATRAEAQRDWSAAEALYREAAATVGVTDARVKAQLDLALVRTRYRMGSAVEAIDMVDRIIAEPKFHEQPQEWQREARELAGRVHYYAAWVMRLEGAQRDLWMEEAELARQNFRLLSEESLGARHTNYSLFQQTNLEAAVRLQRLSLIELMGRPLPEEGQGMAGQGLSEQMARRRGQRGQGRTPGVGEGDEGPPANGAGTQRFPGGPGS